LYTCAYLGIQIHCNILKHCATLQERKKYYRNMSSPWNLRSPSPMNHNSLTSNGSPYGMSPVQISSSIPETSYVTSDAETAIREETQPFNLRATSNVDCAVCQEHFQDGDTVRRLPCNHQFHSACVDPWLRIHARCPLCNSQMPGTTPAPSSHSNPNFRNTSSMHISTVQRRPPRERVGRRNKRRAKRNADLVTGAWLNGVVGGISLLDDDEDDSSCIRRNKAPFFEALNGEDAERFIDEVSMPPSATNLFTITSAPIPKMRI
jgi:hypothetical protein